MATKDVALVLGAHGVVGRSVFSHMNSVPHWRTIGAARRSESPLPRTEYFSVDLHDESQARRALAANASEVTHLMYAVYEPVFRDGKQRFLEETEANTTLLRNAVEWLEQAGAPLRHITVYHGTRAYGADFGAFPTPAKESDPRVVHPSFYTAQEDYLSAHAEKTGTTYTIFRPDIICGVAVGTSTSIVAGVAVYATLCKELGLPLRFPGSAEAYENLLQFTDARLIGRASEWAAESTGAANQIFNLSNGDQFRWSRVWPKIATFFDMPVAPPISLPLATVMEDKGALWDDIVARGDLTRNALSALINWAFVEGVMNLRQTVVTSTIKARRAGFADCIDSEDMILELLGLMRDERIIP